MLENGALGTRRTFLQDGSAAILSAATWGAISSKTANASATPSRTENLIGSHSPGSTKCILLFLHGGPSQLETFDPKPHAPSHIRGPFDAIATAVPGVHFSESLPQLAKLADRFAIIRSLTWDGPAVHAAGIELLQTGASGSLIPQPTLGARLRARERTRWEAGKVPPAVTLGGQLQNANGEEILKSAEEVLSSEVFPSLTFPRRTATWHRVDPELELIYEAQVSAGGSIHASANGGSNSFGENCQFAVRLINAGVRFVTVNMFPRLHGHLSWDCHADGGDLSTTLNDYRDTICPQFDAGCATLLEDLAQSGQLDETLVVAVGEFGRAPRISPPGGREHWTGVWSALIAGGGTCAGAVLGSSNGTAAEPLSRPVAPGELFSRMQQHLGILRESVSSPLSESIRAIRPNVPLAELFK